MAWVITALLAAVLAFSVLRRDRLYSNPSALRENAVYEFAHAPTAEPHSFDTKFFGALNVSTNGREIRIELPSYILTNNAARPQGQLFGGTNTLKFGESAITLLSVGVNYSSASGDRRGPTHYSPDGELQDYNQIREVVDAWRGNLEFQGVFPRVGFCFEMTNVASPDCMVLGFQAFDQRTRRSMLNGYSSSVYSRGPTRINIGGDLELWHQTPVELVLTLATGPLKTSSHPIGLHAPPIHFPGGVLKLVHIADAAINSWGSESAGSTNRLTLHLDENNTGTGTSLAFYGWPRVQGLPVALQINDVLGNPAHQTSQSSSENLLIYGVQEERQQLGSIQLRYYPNVYRLVFHLAELPGLPPENRRLKNLFDTHIPYVRFQYEFKYQEALWKLTAMRPPPHVALTYSNTFFPMIRSNTTVHQLFTEMEGMASDRTRILVVDAEKNEIREEPSAVHTLLEKLRRLITFYLSSALPFHRSARVPFLDSPPSNIGATAENHPHYQGKIRRERQPPSLSNPLCIGSDYDIWQLSQALCSLSALRWQA